MRLLNDKTTTEIDGGINSKPCQKVGPTDPMSGCGTWGYSQYNVDGQCYTQP